MLTELFNEIYPERFLLKNIRVYSFPERDSIFLWLCNRVWLNYCSLFWTSLLFLALCCCGCWFYYYIYLSFWDVFLINHISYFLYMLLLLHWVFVILWGFWCFGCFHLFCFLIVHWWCSYSLIYKNFLCISV